MKIWSILAVVSIGFFLTSCEPTSSEIVPIDKDTYYIARRGYAVTSDVAFPILYKEAGIFCKNQGRAVSPVSSQAEKPDLMSYGIQLTFRCLFENDPEYYDREKEFRINISH